MLIVNSRLTTASFLPSKKGKKYCSFKHKKGIINQKHPFEAVLQIVVLKNFVIFTGKHQCWSLFLIRLWRPAFLLKRDSKASVFSFYRTPPATASVKCSWSWVEPSMFDPKYADLFLNSVRRRGGFTPPPVSSGYPFMVWTSSFHQRYTLEPGINVSGRLLIL